MTETYASREIEALTEIKEALDSADGNLRLVRIFRPTYSWAVQVYLKNRKVGPVLIPNKEKGQTIDDILEMLDSLREDRGL